MFFCVRITELLILLKNIKNNFFFNYVININIYIFGKKYQPGAYAYL